MTSVCTAFTNIRIQNVELFTTVGHWQNVCSLLEEERWQRRNEF